MAVGNECLGQVTVNGSASRCSPRKKQGIIEGVGSLARGLGGGWR